MRKLIFLLSIFMLYFKYRYKTPPKMNQTEALQTAETIFKQFGGQQKLKFFVGANTFTYHNRPEVEEVDATFKFKMYSKANTVKVIYHRCPDVYTLQFWKVTTKQNKLVNSYTHVYFDQLIELFEKETNLYLHF